MRVVVIGAGGHGHVVTDILQATAAAGEPVECGGCLDDHLSSSGAGPVLGPVSALPRLRHDAVVVAIGDNETRANVSSRLQTAGERLAIARHPTSIVATDVRIGGGTTICAGAIVCAGVRLGQGVILNTGSIVDHHSMIGDFAHIAPGVRIGGEVWIGERAFVGIGASILPRITIGAGAIVGAGAVVTRDVPPGVTVAGVPARILKPAKKVTPQ